MHNKNPATSCFYQSNDNVKLHYFFREHTNNDTCCLLLHGFTNDAHIFDHLAEQLQTFSNVIAVDFRGHGDSEWDEKKNYSHDQLIEDIYQLTQLFSFNNWHIIGHSLGARVAMLTIAEKNFQPKSLTIIDTGPEVRAIGVRKVRQDAENTPKNFSSVDHFFYYLSSIYFLADTKRLRLLAENGLKERQGQLVAKTDPEFTKALWRQDSHQGNSSDLTASKEHDLWQALTSITCSCLIIRGQASAILTQRVAEKMQRTLENAELAIIPRSGHALMLDNPSYFENSVLRFIRNVNVFSLSTRVNH